MTFPARFAAMMSVAIVPTVVAAQGRVPPPPSTGRIAITVLPPTPPTHGGVYPSSPRGNNGYNGYGGYKYYASRYYEKDNEKYYKNAPEAATSIDS